MIPNDSRYCDMCGTELLECIKCGTLDHEMFCPECGAPMIKRKLRAGGCEEKTLVLKPRTQGSLLRPAHDAVIGREDSPYASELAGCPLISRRHGKFVKRDTDWYIVDFGSTNGTYVNDREVPANTLVKIAAGDVVDIGTYIFDAVEE